MTIRGLDAYITGNYGEHQFRSNRPITYQQRKGEFLDSLVMDMYELGHCPWPWTKGKHGFHTHCKYCGAVASCTVYNGKIKEFPQTQCPQAIESPKKDS